MTKTMTARELYRARLITIHEFATLQWQERLAQWQAKSCDQQITIKDYICLEH